jgi:hypothetical protein
MKVKINSVKVNNSDVKARNNVKGKKTTQTSNDIKQQ